MSSLLSVTLLSSATLGLWGVSDFLAGRAGRQVNTYVVNAILLALSLLIITPTVMIWGLSLGTWRDLLIIAMVAALFTVAYLFFIRAMALGPVGVAAPIGNAYAFVTLVLSLVFFNLAFSGITLISLGIIVVGAVLLCASRELFSGKVLHSRTVKLALVPMVTWGVGFALLNLVTDAYAWQESLFLLGVGQALFSIIVMLVAVPAETYRFQTLFSRRHLPAVAAGLTMGAGGATFFLAADIGNSFVIPAVIAAGSPLVTSLFAYIFDKEKLSLLNRIGAVLVVAGVALLNV